jgi:hypothetical protein
VDDALLVGFLQGFRDLASDAQRFVHRDGTALQPLREILALDQLEDEQRLAVQLFETVDRGDVWMIQRGEQVGFTAEAGESFGVLRDLGRQQLDRDAAAQPRVAGALYLAHAARTQRAENLVRPEPRAGAQRHRLSCGAISIASASRRSATFLAGRPARLT